MRKNYYIFLDIDGVLWDWKFLIDKIKRKETSFKDFKFKSESVDALNYLIYCINDKFDAKLVISSTWRVNMFFTKNMLYNNGLIYNKEIESTKFFPPSRKRGEQILDFLNKKNEPNNYVVIDNNNFDFAKTLDTNKVIKTDGKTESLTYDLVDNFLSKNPDILDSIPNSNESLDLEDAPFLSF